MNAFAWKYPGVGRHLTYFAVMAALYFTILLVIEYRVFSGILYKIRALFHGKLPDVTEEGYLDADVLHEKQRIDAMPLDEIKSYNLVLQQVSKFYGRFLAVNQISIGIQQ